MTTWKWAVGLLCVVLWPMAAVGATTHYAADWSELVAANTAATDGDTIVLTGTTYTQAAAITFSKNLTIYSGHSSGRSTIAGDANPFTIAGQAAGTTQSWIGVVFDRQANNQSACRVVTTGGHLTVQFTACEFRNSGNLDGLTAATSAAAAHDLDVTCQGCTATGNGNDGYNLKQGAGGTGTSTMTLRACVAYGNSNDGASPHGDCTMIVVGGQFYDNGKNALVNTDAGSVLTATDVYMEQATTPTSHLVNAANTATATFTRCTFVGSTAANQALVTAGGGDITLYSCTIHGTGNNTQLLRAAGGKLTVWDTSLSASGTYDLGVTKPMIYSSTSAGSELYLYRSLVDASQATCGSSYAIIYARNPCNVEGSVIIQGAISGTTATYTQYAIQYGPGSSGSVIHCTLYPTDTVQRPNGVYVEVDGIVVRGNLIPGCYWGIRAGTANYYDGVAGSGYNVILDSLSAPVYGDTAIGTDVTTGTTPTFVSAFDLRLLTRGVAADVDPNDCYLIPDNGYLPASPYTREAGGVGTEQDAGAYRYDAGAGLARVLSSGVHRGARPVTLTTGVAHRRDDAFGQYRGETGVHKR